MWKDGALDAYPCRAVLIAVVSANAGDDLACVRGPELHWLRAPVLQCNFLASVGADVPGLPTQPLGCHKQLPCACLGGESCCYAA